MSETRHNALFCLGSEILFLLKNICFHSHTLMKELEPFWHLAGSGSAGLKC